MEKTEEVKIVMPISGIFLQEFARRIVIYGYSDQIRKITQDYSLKQSPKKVLAEKKETQQPQRQVPRQMQVRRPTPIRRQNMPPRNQAVNYVKKLISGYSKQQVRQPGIAIGRRQSNTLRNMTYEQSLGTPIQIIGLEKVMPLLNDPYAQSIECPGPDRPLLINKIGKTEATQIVLSTEQISKILQQISEMTRIPIISGVFKTAFDKYLMTAVISDVVGTRFILQKKTKPEDTAI